jgi:restriction endonuclease S subunit
MIPIPSIKRQKEIADYCERNDTLIKQLKDKIEESKKLAHDIITQFIESTNILVDVDRDGKEPIDE